MKKLQLAILSAALLAQWPAFAGNTQCRENISLVCRTTFNQAGGGVSYGPSASAAVGDIQPEPFDPADCEASLVIQLDSGKIIAWYSDDLHQMRATFEPKGGKERLVITDAPVDPVHAASALLSDASGAGFDSTTLTCEIYDSN